MTALLAAILLATAPIEAPPEDPTIAVWVQPVGPIFVPMVTSMISLGGLRHAWTAFSMGTTFSARQFDVVTEFGWARTTAVNLGTNNEFFAIVATSVSAGIVLHTGDRALSGFFFEPRLQFQMIYEELGRFSTGYDLQVGMNVGYQLVLAKRVFIAFVIGGSIGGGSEQMSSFSGAFHPGMFPAGVFGPRETRLVVGLNAHLIRVGFAF